MNTFTYYSNADIKEEQYFNSRGFTDQHMGGQAFAKDESIMGWLFGAH